MTADASGLRVTIVAHDVGGVGGMETVLGRLVEGLLARGHRVTVVARSCRLDPHERLRFVRVPGPARPFTLAYPWFFIAGSLLARLHRGEIVHTTGAIVLARADVCTVHLCHHAIADRSAGTRASRTGVLYRLNAALAARMSRLAERVVYRPSRTRVLTAVSTGTQRELRAHFPAMAARIVVVPNGVDVTHFAPVAEPRSPLRAELGLPAADRLAVLVGSEWGRKGLAVAIETIAVAPGWRLLVVGAGDERAFGAHARAHGVADRIHFHGVAPDVVDCLRAADAFLLPTRYESFSLATYEAAACGLPLLAGRACGIEDILRDGINGWFVEQDPVAIAARLAELADPALAAEMGAEARRSSLAFTWERAVAGYESCYASVRR